MRNFDHAVSGEDSCALFGNCSFGLMKCHSPADSFVQEYFG